MPLIGALAASSWRLAMSVPLAASAVALAALALRPADAADADAAEYLATGQSRPLRRGLGAGRAFRLRRLGRNAHLRRGADRIVWAVAGPDRPARSPPRPPPISPATCSPTAGREAPHQLLAVLGAGLAILVAVFGAVRPALLFSVALFALIALLAGARALAGSAAGLDAAPRVEVTVMSIRGAATQFGMVAGVLFGGVALAAGGYGMLGAALSILFAAGAVYISRRSADPSPIHAGLIPATRAISR